MKGICSLEKSGVKNQKSKKISPRNIKSYENRKKNYERKRSHIWLEKNKES